MSQSHPTRKSEEIQDDDPYVSQLGVCAKLYSELEECLGNHNREWRKCQYLVKALEVCNNQAERQKRKIENQRNK